MDKDSRQLGIGTRLTRLGRDPDTQYGFVNGPVYRGSTVLFRTLADLEQSRARFSYGTQGRPTIENLEQAWTEITGAAGTVLSPSGQSTLIMA